MIRKTTLLLSALVLVAVILSACQPAPASPTPNLGPALTQAVATALAQLATPTFTPSPVPTVPTATATYSGPAPELAPVFTTNLLDPYSTPHTYIGDTCQYLKAKWNPNNATPGTIVMVIMFHSVVKGVQTATESNSIGGGDFKKLMNNLHDMGFQAIDTKQLEGFLYENAKIPVRSVVLIKDDRHAAQDYNDWFRTYWEQWGWPVVNAWISKDDSITQQFLAGNVELEKEGWVDHQAHGVVHNIPMTDSSSDDYIHSELQGSINFLQQYFGKTPIAIIWPGGGFGVRPVQIARQLGYKLGFTVNPRGPIMFNWVPLADSEAPDAHPGWLAEGPVNDPLMTLPRYWDTDALANLDKVRIIGQQAAAYAEQNKATELDYYNIVCAPKYGPIPAAQ